MGQPDEVVSSKAVLELELIHQITSPGFWERITHSPALTLVLFVVDNCHSFCRFCNITRSLVVIEL